jgi:hypothetical protein
MRMVESDEVKDEPFRCLLALEIPFLDSTPPRK